MASLDHRIKKNIWLCILCFLITSDHPDKFGGLMFCGSGHITFFIRHVSWYENVINELCNFVYNSPSSEATSLSGLVVIYLSRNITFSFVILLRDHMIKWPRAFLGVDPSSKLNRLLSFTIRSLVELEI